MNVFLPSLSSGFLFYFFVSSIFIRMETWFAANMLSLYSVIIPKQQSFQPKIRSCNQTTGLEWSSWGYVLKLNINLLCSLFSLHSAYVKCWHHSKCSIYDHWCMRAFVLICFVVVRYKISCFFFFLYYRSNFLSLGVACRCCVVSIWRDLAIFPRHFKCVQLSIIFSISIGKSMMFIFPSINKRWILEPVRSCVCLLLIFFH